MRTTIALVVSLVLVVSSGAAIDGWHEKPSNEPVEFSTLIKTALAIEGLTGDDAGNLYTVGRAGANGVPCLVWRVNVDNPSLAVVGFVPAPSAAAQCSPSGLAFNADRDLFVADGGRVYRLTPSSVTQPTATVFAAGVPGTNGLAFDRSGNLWTGDGTTGQGRVWRVSPIGVVQEMFRVQPMRNSNALGGLRPDDGVGRQVRDFPPGTLSNTAGAQDLVANGVAFNHEGDLLIADTARGALWKVSFDQNGEVENAMGCDETLPADTLCLDSVYIAHPLLEGVDGIALDEAGNVWADANERNALVFVTKSRREVVEIFRNPVHPASGLRNEGPLEFPTSPFLLGHRLCTSNSDNDRRDNSPRAAGELGTAFRGKISCVSGGFALAIPGLPLPIR